jgi:hypothetical protein
MSDDEYSLQEIRSKFKDKISELTPHNITRNIHEMSRKELIATIDKIRKINTSRLISRFSIGKPNINIHVDMRNGLRKVSEKFNSKGQEPSLDKKLALLKRCYDRGFISLEEYRDALKRQGVGAENSKSSEYREGIKSKGEEGIQNKHQRIFESKNAEKTRVDETKKKELKKDMEDKEVEKKETEKEIEIKEAQKAVIPEKSSENQE